MAKHAHLLKFIFIGSMCLIISFFVYVAVRNSNNTEPEKIEVERPQEEVLNRDTAEYQSPEEAPPQKTKTLFNRFLALFAKKKEKPIEKPAIVSMSEEEPLEPHDISIIDIAKKELPVLIEKQKEEEKKQEESARQLKSRLLKDFKPNAQNCNLFGPGSEKKVPQEIEGVMACILAGFITISMEKIQDFEKIQQQWPELSKLLELNDIQTELIAIAEPNIQFMIFYLPQSKNNATLLKKYMNDMAETFRFYQLQQKGQIFKKIYQAYSPQLQEKIQEQNAELWDYTMQKHYNRYLMGVLLNHNEQGIEQTFYKDQPELYEKAKKDAIEWLEKNR